MCATTDNKLENLVCADPRTRIQKTASMSIEDSILLILSTPLTITQNVIETTKHYIAEVRNKYGPREEFFLYYNRTWTDLTVSHVMCPFQNISTGFVKADAAFDEIINDKAHCPASIFHFHGMHGAFQSPTDEHAMHSFAAAVKRTNSIKIITTESLDFPVKYADSCDLMLTNDVGNAFVRLPLFDNEAETSDNIQQLLIRSEYGVPDTTIGFAYSVVMSYTDHNYNRLSTNVAVMIQAVCSRCRHPVELNSEFIQKLREKHAPLSIGSNNLLFQTNMPYIISKDSVVKVDTKAIINNVNERIQQECATQTPQSRTSFWRWSK